MQDSYFPFTIIQQINGALRIKINALYTKYKFLNYSLADGDKSHHIEIKNRDELVISDFTIPGLYYFYLSDEENSPTPRQEIYITKDTDAEVYKKITSYIMKPEDENYISSLIKNLPSPTISYTYQIGQTYKALKDPQDYEKNCLYQLILAAERYENTIAVKYNQGNATGVFCHYDTNFSVSIPPQIDSMTVLSYEDGIEKFCYQKKINDDTVSPIFSENTFYRINFYSDAELIISLVHYQLDEDGMSYLWQQQKEYDEQQCETIKQIDHDIINDSELSYAGVSLTSEDKDRIVEEQRYQPKDYLIERVKVVPSALDSKVLIITIPDYNILEADTYYLSVTERDILNESSFDLRFKITAKEMTLDTRKELLDDELMFCIRNSQGAIVSKYTRYCLQTEMHDYINEYNEKLNLFENHVYAKQLLLKFSASFGSNLLPVFSDIVMSLCKDPLLSTNLLKKEIILATRYSKLSNRYNDIVYFIEANWLEFFTNVTPFFKNSKPIFYYSENRIIMPKFSHDYIVCAEHYNLTTGQHYVSYLKSSDAGVSIKTNISDVCCIYAIDPETRYRSGFILVNNFTKQISQDKLEYEVDAYNG